MADTSPFFVTGFQRSGTTLLRVMLDNHPDVAIPLDAPRMWERYEKKLSDYGDLADEASVRRLITDLLSEERIRLWEVPLDVETVLKHKVREGYPGVIDAFYRAYAAAKGKPRWGDKDPGNVLRIHILDRWFPGCRIVHIIRDGRASCLSHLEQSFGAYHLLGCADDWREQVWWVRRMGQLLGPERYFELRYEDLVKEPEAKLREVCAFLDLAWEPGMLQYHKNVDASIPAEKRHIWKLIGEPPRADNATRWKTQLSRGAQICFEKRAGRMLQEMGYETTPPPWKGAYLTEMGFMLQAAFQALKLRLGIRAR